MSILGRLIRGTRLEPVAREVVRATWSEERRGDDRDMRCLQQILTYVLREDSSCIDVGAHMGAVLYHFARLAPRGRHHAFEPIPHLAAELRRLFPGVAVHEAAASDRTGEAEFHHVVTNAGYSGLRRRTYARPDERVELIRVRLCRIDDVFPEDQRVDFVKIDVEGAELEVLRGATRTLRRWSPHVVFEHGLGASDHYGTTPEAIHRLLAGELGLSIFDMEGAGPLSEAAFAAVYGRGRKWNFLARPYRRPPQA
jgi:FkbM family methyltransferase